MRVSLLIFLIFLFRISDAQCPTGYNCTACSDSSCASCSADLSVCDSCSDGYYLDIATCTACPSKCLKCESSSVCLSCMPGYDQSSDDAGNAVCTFYWWKWFLIVFGTLLGLVLLGGLIWWVRNKLKDQENVKEVNYQMKAKHEATEHTLKE